MNQITLSGTNPGTNSSWTITVDKEYVIATVNDSAGDGNVVTLRWNDLNNFDVLPVAAQHITVGTFTALLPHFGSILAKREAYMQLFD